MAKKVAPKKKAAAKKKKPAVKNAKKKAPKKTSLAVLTADDVKAILKGEIAEATQAEWEKVFPTIKKEMLELRDEFLKGIPGEIKAKLHNPLTEDHNASLEEHGQVFSSTYRHPKKK